MQCNERIDYWDFICEYLPNYENRDDVLLSDILFRFTTGVPLQIRFSLKNKI